MLEIFSFPFMVRAFMAGSVVAIIAPFIGTFLFTKRYSLIADTLAHVSLAGIALGLVLNFYPLYTALIVALLAAVVIERLRRAQKIPGDAALAMFLSGGLALAVTVMSLKKGFTGDVVTYLFGSITTVSQTDVLMVVALGILVLLVLLGFYKELFYTVFDEETATVNGLPTGALNMLLMVVTAVTVTIAMRIVGVLLIGSLMIIPVLTALQIARSFKSTIIWAIIFSVSSVLIGLYLSYYLNVVAGGMVVLVAMTEFLTMSFAKFLKR